MKNLIFTVAALTLLLTCSVFSQRPSDLRGHWSGNYQTTGPGGTIEMTFGQTRSRWSGDVSIKYSDNDVRGKMKSLAVKGDRLTFAADFEGNNAKFTGRIQRRKITGTFRLYSGGTIADAGTYCLSRSSNVKCTNADLAPVPSLTPGTKPTKQTTGEAPRSIK